MKKYVLVVAVAAALFSCSGNPKADATQTDKNKQETAQVPTAIRLTDLYALCFPRRSAKSHRKAKPWCGRAIAATS